MVLLEKILTHELFPLLVLVVVVVLLMIKSWTRSRQARFERKLPTSKIGALTVGIVEVMGRIREIETCKSPHFNNTCIGYSYTIEEKHTWNDGKTSYFEKYRENKILPFEIYDDTGSVQVDVSGLIVEQLRTSSDLDLRRGLCHKVSLLVPGHEFFIIARAEAREGQLVLCQDEQNSIFSMKPHREVIAERAIAPLINLVMKYCLAIILLIALIVIA